MKPFVKLMRMHHYIKNFLIFAPLVCSGELFNTNKLWKSIVGFFVFCLASSIVYIVNDIRDVEKDRRHPTKRNRPIASGAISKRQAELLSLSLLLIAAATQLKIGSIGSTGLVLGYLVINLAYSFGLKNIPLIDVTILVAGFVIRVLYGAAVTKIVISNWLYLTVIAVAFYFALGKRRNELTRVSDGETRQVLKNYAVNFLDKNMYMCLSLANGFYALWSMDAITAAHYNNRQLVFTVPIVLLITMKYSMDIEGTYDGDPVEVLLHDKILMALCVVYLVIMFLILYF